MADKWGIHFRASSWHSFPRNRHASFLRMLPINGFSWPGWASSCRIPYSTSTESPSMCLRYWGILCSHLNRNWFWENIHHLGCCHGDFRFLAHTQPLLQKFKHFLVSQQTSVTGLNANSHCCFKSISLEKKEKGNKHDIKSEKYDSTINRTEGGRIKV